MKLAVLPLLVLVSIAAAVSAAEPRAVFEDRFVGKLGDGWTWLRENPKAWRIRERGTGDPRRAGLGP